MNPTILELEARGFLIILHYLILPPALLPEIMRCPNPLLDAVGSQPRGAVKQNMPEGRAPSSKKVGCDAFSASGLVDRVWFDVHSVIRHPQLGAQVVPFCPVLGPLIKTEHQETGYPNYQGDTGEPRCALLYFDILFLLR